MYTNIEFLDSEPIENVITCMHYKMDKVIFFGYEDEIEEYRERTSKFLKKYCEIPEVEFFVIEKQDLKEVIVRIEEVVKSEESLGNNVYFDITGGESLFLVAFGVLAEKLEKPMHMYDVEADQLIHLGKHYEDHVGNVPSHNIQFNLNSYIEMYGAKIDETKKSCVDVNDAMFMAKVDSLWSIVLDFKRDWNDFCGILRDSLSVEKSLDATNTVIKTKNRSMEKFHKFMLRLKELGAISCYKSQIISRNEAGRIAEVKVTISYTDFAWKECITKAGTALELYVYKNLKDAGKEVQQSVHIDWDGIIKAEQEQITKQSNSEDDENDVLNEIDVLMLEGNIPTFISCKCGKMNKGKALQPMYELETVANRFGGKYAKKVLATLSEVRGAYAERAEEMNIKLDCYGE